MRIVALMLGIAIACPVRAQDTSGAGRMNGRGPTITATGHGEARITPDRATLSIGVQTKAATAAQASADNAQKQRAVIDALKSLGIADQQISTVEYSVYPESAPMTNSERAPRIIGYTVSNTVRVDVQKIDRLGALIDAALGHGANSINSLDFSSSHEDDARRAALAIAVQRARGDAEAMARGAGGRLGDLVDLSSQSGSRPIAFGARMSLAAGAATPISPGSETVSVEVAGQWRYVAQ
ncbi:MAG TPA: SIMPL domain-containing protein [Gemmatimonadaceae bacterium]|nr:SIMPL domain-containing protein [Gemmatimonadaceae bacterium]